MPRHSPYALLRLNFLCSILLEFAYNLFYNEKAFFTLFFFLGFAYLSICGQIVVPRFSKRPWFLWSQFLFLNPVKLSVRFSYLVFNEHSFFEISPKSPSRDALQTLMNFIRICLRRLAAGGDEGNRTLDPLLAGQVLSQLSYTPIKGLLLLFQWSADFSAADHWQLNNKISRHSLCLCLPLVISPVGL